MKFNNVNVQISPRAKIGRNVRIGDNTIIYDNVEIGDDAIICNDCIIGEPLNAYYQDTEAYQNPPTYLGANALIRSHCIIYAGSRFGTHFSCGHRVTIREQSRVGNHCAFGTLCDIQGWVELGDYCRLHSNVHIGQQSKIGNFVFIYPYVVFTNDPHPPSNICQGPTVGDYTQIAVHAILLPGVSIGQNCLVGAGATVGSDFGDEVVIVGSPAKAKGSVRNVTSREQAGEAHYPWMYHFSRGMPWAEIGYDAWLAKQDQQ